MGTTCTKLPANVKDYFLNEVLVWSAESHYTYTVLDIKIVALSEVYAAVERIDKETGERMVWAFVSAISFSRDRYYGFCHKDMEEDIGPYQSRCPKSILDLLTPTDSKWANQWRERCRAYHARPKPIQVTVNGVVTKTYEKFKLAQKAAFKLAKANEADAVVLHYNPTKQAWRIYPWGGWEALAG